MYDFLVDSHCHLKYICEEHNMTEAEVIKDANDNGVKILNNISADMDEIDDLLETSRKYGNVYLTIGQHPENVRKGIPTVENLLKIIDENSKIIGVGETGLDYHFDNDNETKKLQRENFLIHIEAVRKSKLPLVIHSRDCDEDMIEILEAEQKKGEFKFLLHCFSSGAELAYKSLDLGGYVSFSGILTFKNAVDIQEIAKNIPLNKILVETDAPYLAPVPLRGKTNVPANVKYVAKFLANLLNKDFSEIQSATTENFFRLFRRNS